MRIRRVTKHAYRQQKQNRPADAAGRVQASIGYQLLQLSYLHRTGLAGLLGVCASGDR